MNEAISSCDAAIDALKNSKQSLQGAKIDLTQVTSGLVTIVQRQPALSELPAAVELFSKLQANGAPKFEYQSNDIIATLEDLAATFQSNKADLDKDEINQNQSFERAELGMLNSKKFKEKESNENAQISEAKQEAIAQATDQRQSEQTDHDSDAVFMKRLSFDCEDKAKSFDKRSDTRSGELTALNTAVKELQSGVVNQYKANKELVGLQMAAVGRARKIPVASQSGKPVTLVQVKQHQQSSQQRSIERVRSFLNAKAASSESGALDAIAVRVGLVMTQTDSAEDHFVKVRGLIQDLLEKLKADALSEKNQKGECDIGIKKATGDRDEAHARLEAAHAKLTVSRANKDSTEDNNKALCEQIAELKKAILEATELADKDLADLDAREGLCEEAVTSMKLAMGILEQFYSKAKFLQVDAAKAPPSKYVTSRDGKTVGDMAPDTGTLDGGYHGAQSEATGIVGILEVILDDFERNEVEVAADIKFTKDAILAFTKDANKDVDAKTTQRDETNAGLLSGIGEDIVTQEQEVMDANKLLDGAVSALEGWHVMCVKGEETFEQRSQKREDEIEALKQAQTMLEEWQS